MEKEANKHERNNDGPFAIAKVNKNGTVRSQMGATSDLVNTRRITPCCERKQNNVQHVPQTNEIFCLALFNESSGACQSVQ